MSFSTLVLLLDPLTIREYKRSFVFFKNETILGTVLLKTEIPETLRVFTNLTPFHPLTFLT